MTDFEELIPSSTVQASPATEPEDTRSVTCTNTTESEAAKLIEAIRSMPPPKVKLTMQKRVTERQIHEENLLRNRIPSTSHPLEKSVVTGKIKKTTDDTHALTAPSVSTKPLPLPTFPNFDKMLREVGLIKPNEKTSDEVRFFTDCRILSEDLLKKLIMKRAEILVVKKEAKMVDQATQTYVTFAVRQHVVGCINGRSAELHFKDCSLPYRPGFCQICGAEGFDTQDCIYPHEIEHGRILHCCPGCSKDLSLYCPECPDCNVRHAGHSDWLRLNYAAWPTWLIPQDHRYLFDENEKVLKRRVRAKFTDPRDHSNQVRAFLIRENALLTARPSNPRAQSALQLSKEKRQQAIDALYNPLTVKTLDKIMEERPELQDDEEVTVIVRTKFKKLDARPEKE